MSYDRACEPTGLFGLRRMKLAVSASHSMTILCLLLLWICSNTAAAAQALHPLAPPDTSSPRATLNTFLNEMNKAVATYKAGHRDQAFDFLNGAVRCLNLDTEPPATRPVLGLYTALYLKETLDRIDFPSLEDIPDARTAKTEKLTSWTVPYTEITIEAVKGGNTEKRFLFSPQTVKGSEEFYNKVKSLPYKPGAEGALYEQLTSSAGPIVPKELMDRLPQWMRVEVFGQKLWQWMGLILYFLVGTAAVLLTIGGVRKALGILDAKLNSSLTDSLGGLIIPIILVLFADTGLWFIVYGLHFRDADTYLAIAFVFLLISYGARMWFVGAILSRAAGFVIALARIEPMGMYAQLIRFGFDVVTVIIVIGAAIRLGARLGLPTYSLVTGLGVGGLAVALAGREALSNVIGTIAILLDRPFKLGDFVVLGEGDRGTVTEIGLRSTRIQRLDGILVSIPNATIASMKIINESAPVAESQISVPVGVAYGSSVSEVERALLTACQRCEYAVPEPAPSIRLVSYGDSSVEFQVLVWIVQPEFRAKATDQINRAIGEEFEKRGIDMPFPQRDVHIKTTA
ncbi:MAG: mechanosensitive ion channel family protein [Desulfomonilaceae bacterium]